MSLISSNTYTEPTSGTSLNNARLQQNDTFRSLLTNFYSSAAPVGINIVAAGASLGPQDGMLYRSANTSALYVWDSTNKKNAPVGGSFTRVGIGNRVENGITALAANATSYEIGELVATVSENSTINANARLYLCISNTATVGSTANFKDVGEPLGYSVGTLNNITFSGQSVTGSIFLSTSNVGIKTTAPSAELHVSGNALITNNTTIGSYLVHNGDTNTYLGFPANDTITLRTSGADRLYVLPSGNVGIGTTIPRANLHVRSSAPVIKLDSTSPAAAAFDGSGTGIELLSSTVSLSSQIFTPAIKFGSTDSSLTTTNPKFGAAIVAEAKQTYSNDNTGGMALSFWTANINPGTGHGLSKRLEINHNGEISALSNVSVTGTVTASGDVVAYSDIRLKANIHTIPNALDIVDNLRGVYFEKDNKRSLGLIAQEVEAIIPEVVHTDEYKAIAYGNLVGVLVEAIKELRTEVQELRNAIAK